MGKKDKKRKASTIQTNEESNLDVKQNEPMADDVTTVNTEPKEAPDASNDSSSAAIVPNSFASITPALSPPLLHLLQTTYQFTQMTPIQAATIPLFLRNSDVCAQAATGSGKTLAFLLPLLEILRRSEPLKPNEIGGLVLSPTRELAAQTHKVATELCKVCCMPAPLLLVGGGGNRSVLSDLQTFKEQKSDLIVATPGRFQDVVSRYESLNLKSLEVLILDEADVLLDMGFETTVCQILSRLPKMRRTGLFSATQTRGVKALARAGLRNPVVITVAAADAKGEVGGKAKAKKLAVPTTLINHYHLGPLDDKLDYLLSFLQTQAHTSTSSVEPTKIIVFFLTCASVEFYTLALQNLLLTKQYKDTGIHLEGLHGKMVQKRREHTLQRFRDSTTTNTLNSNVSVLFCTDVAARGLDVADITWVVQFDAPPDPHQYIHRIGRCARAGKRGKSLVLLTEKEGSFVEFCTARFGLTLQPMDNEDGDEDDDDDMEEDVMDKDDTMDARESIETDDDRIDDKCSMDKESADKEEANEAPEDNRQVLTGVRNLVLHDRDLLEKGTKAFTSYIRAYKEHQCAFIFRFASVDLGALATSFCLLRLPKMPELRDYCTNSKSMKLLKKKGLSRKEKDKTNKQEQHLKKTNSILLPNFTPAGPEVDIYAIKFKDKVREQARQKRLAAELAAGGKNAKQIKAEQRTAAKIAKVKERREAEKAKGRNPDKKKKGKQQRLYDEWDEYAKEERLFKKMRCGKISKEEYQKLMYGDSGNKDKPEEEEENSDIDD